MEINEKNIILKTLFKIGDNLKQGLDVLMQKNVTQSNKK